MTTTPQYVAHYADLADRYQGLIVDLWGVMHDGLKVFDQAAQCLAQLRKSGKRVVFLTNAPRRSQMIEAQLPGLGIDRDWYDGLMSSGQEAWLDLRSANHYGDHFYHIGYKREDQLMQGLNYTKVDSVEAADFIINSGPCGQAGLDDYDDLLHAGAKDKCLMLCLNPDREVLRGGKRMLCAGALAERYTEIGGLVRNYGKPGQSIYDLCLKMLDISDRTKVLAIGDSLATDIIGANRAEIDSLLVLSGVHGRDIGCPSAGELLSSPFDPNPGKCQRLFTNKGAFPRWTMDVWRW